VSVKCLHNNSHASTLQQISDGAAFCILNGCGEDTVVSLVFYTYRKAVLGQCHRRGSVELFFELGEFSFQLRHVISQGLDVLFH
jgi:hypothetical protein